MLRLSAHCPNRFADFAFVTSRMPDDSSADEKTKTPRFWYNRLAHFGQDDKCRGLAALGVVNVMDACTKWTALCILQ